MLFAPNEIALDKTSKVTETVRSGWEFQRPLADREIMYTVEHNVLAVEERDNGKYLKAAEELKVSTEVVKGTIQKNVERLARESDVFRMTSFRVLNGLLNVEGRFLTQFEVGESKAVLDKKMRAFVEAKMFGFNMEEKVLDDLKESDITKEMINDNKATRPIYAYLSNDTNGIVMQHDTDLVGNLEFYGDVAIKFKKKSIEDRATVSFKDSLDTKMEVVPSPLKAPHFTSMGIPEGPLDGRPLKERIEDAGSTSRPKWGELYAEVQLHGQMTFEDVESIHVSKGDPGKVYVVREIFDRFKRSHPESKIRLVVY